MAEEKLVPFAALPAVQACAQTEEPETMQINIGRRCNLACRHCHVGAGPARTEEMTWETMADCLAVFADWGLRTLDVTGGAPELHPHFRRLIAAARAAGARTLVRTNLTAMTEEGRRDLPAFCAAQGVELIGSLPYYAEKDTDRQRGDGVFAACLAAMRTLNALGYGVRDELPLHLVYNPGGAFLPPDQRELEEEYRLRLGRLGVRFTGLYVLANCPIGRFGEFLDRSGNRAGYMARLAAAFNPAAAARVMCRRQISVDWDGAVYDCDFNLALGLRAALPEIAALRGTKPARRAIAFGDHCYACTAGAGSSCCGAVV